MQTDKPVCQHFKERKHTMPQNKDKLIIANCSGFFGDRLSSAKEMVQGGPIDVLTGDYLAELTMAILIQKKLKDPNAGFVPTFLKQMQEIMSECLEKNIKVVCNAGGLNPSCMASALKEIAENQGLTPKIAYIEGDDLMPRLQALQAEGEPFSHLDKNIPLSESKEMPITANAYLGGWGIAKALKLGADIVVCGRVADAALVSGPAAWHFGWHQNDWNSLAGAYAAGHIIECGAQATGGNYSFIDEVPSFKNVGFPIAEIFDDGSFVITKHPNTGGLVSVGTVTAQLLYEINEPKYLTPDVSVRFDTLSLKQENIDRVHASGIKGAPPPETTKVCINNLGGHKNSMTVILTGLDIEKKAKIVQDILFESLSEQPKKVDVQLIRSDRENPNTNDDAFAFLKITVMDQDSKKVGKAFSSKVVEMALANIPGFTLTAPPSKSTPTVIHWPALVSSSQITQTIHIGDERFSVPALIKSDPFEPIQVNPPQMPPLQKGNLITAPFGRAFATRSGDKGGNANLGVWAQTLEGYTFLQEFLTIEKLKDLLPDCKPFKINRYELPNLLAVNFYIHGLLGDGVAASVRSDPQAKTLGEYLRAKIVEMPEDIVMG
jgi:hypothetical protein